MWSNTKRNRVITVKNVSNDGEDDAYDTRLATITFLYWPDQGNGGTDGSLRNSENWIICTDTRQTSHKTLLLKVKVSRSAIFCLAAADSLLQSANFPRNETLPALLTTYRKCGVLAHVTSSPLSTIAHMSHCLSHTSCVTWKTVRNLENTIVNLCHCGLFSIVSDILEMITIVLSHVHDYSMRMIVFSHVDDYSMRIQTDFTDIRQMTSSTGSMSDLRLVSAWSLHCKLLVTSIIVTFWLTSWQLFSCSRDQGQAGRGNDHGQLFVGLEYLFSPVGIMM